MSGEPVLRVEGLSKSFAAGRGARTAAVSDVSFDLGRGRVLAVAGESGSGKSTIARLLLGTVRRDSGRIEFEGRAIDDSDGRDLAWMRRRCALVQQDPYDSLNPRMRVAEIISEPLGVHGAPAGERRTRALSALSEVGLEPASEIAARLPGELSGGQRQRVAIARALSLRPSLIIADEPVSMLDVSVRAGILDLMRNLRGSHGVSFLYITHDLATARHFADELAVLYAGRIVERGPPAGVLGAPRHPYTQALIDALPAIGAGRRQDIRILGDARPAASGCAFRRRCPYAVDQCSDVPRLGRDGGAWDAACFAPLG